MTTIYDNEKYQQLGYTGILFREFYYKYLRISINQGSTTSGAHKRVRAYSIDVYMKPINLFTLMAYQGKMLYGALSQDPPMSDEQLVNLIFATACEHTNTVDLISRLVSDTYYESKRMGQHEVRSSIKEALGLKEE